MWNKSFLNKLEPELVYMAGSSTVPAKALEYKKDPTTNNIKEIITPRTHEFENALKKDLIKELKEVDLFPTDKEVFIVVSHGFRGKKEHNKCDLDNRAKTILDALKGPVYKDDSQVKILWTYKELAVTWDDNYFSFLVKILDNPFAESFIKSIKELYKSKN